MNPLDYVRGNAPSYDDMSRGARHVRDSMRDSLYDARDAAAARGERMLEATEDYTRNEPIKALAIAAAVGALAVLILTSTWPSHRSDR
jgi:ElaB/YqjD/DUF883 family membrane-anchored ribosome-binding protein